LRVRRRARIRSASLGNRQRVRRRGEISAVILLLVLLLLLLLLTLLLLLCEDIRAVEYVKF
jgi:hypothetical protein